MRSELGGLDRIGVFGSGTCEEGVGVTINEKMFAARGGNCGDVWTDGGLCC